MKNAIASAALSVAKDGKGLKNIVGSCAYELQLADAVVGLGFIATIFAISEGMNVKFNFFTGQFEAKRPGETTDAA